MTGEDVRFLKKSKLETRVFAPPHLHIVAYFCFSFLSFFGTLLALYAEKIAKNRILLRSYG